VDVIGIDSEFCGYKVLVLPMLYMISEENSKRIAEYVANGGTVIATYITGYVNETDLCYMGGFPGGKLKEVFGMTADEIDTLYERDWNEVEIWGERFKAVDYCELITPDTAEVIGRYQKDFYAGKPAILKNQYYAGTAYYIGCRDTGGLLNKLYRKILEERGIVGYKLPEGVTIHTRQDGKNLYLFVENYTDSVQVVRNLGTYKDVASGVQGKGSVRLQGYEIKVLKKVKDKWHKIIS
jgi:beta-galactosidase